MQISKLVDSKSYGSLCQSLNTFTTYLLSCRFTPLTFHPLMCVSSADSDAIWTIIYCSFIELPYLLSCFHLVSFFVDLESNGEIAFIVQFETAVLSVRWECRIVKVAHCCKAEVSPHEYLTSVVGSQNSTIHSARQSIRTKICHQHRWLVWACGENHSRIGLNDLRSPDLYPVKVQPWNSPLRWFPFHSRIVPRLQLNWQCK